MKKEQKAEMKAERMASHEEEEDDENSQDLKAFSKRRGRPPGPVKKQIDAKIGNKNDNGEDGRNKSRSAVSDNLKNSIR